MIFRFQLTFSIIILYIYIIMLGLTPFAMISLTGIIFVILGLFLYIRGWSSKTFIYMENGIGNIIVGLIIFTYLIWISISSKNYINLKSGFGLLFVLLNVVSYSILCFNEIFKSRSTSLRIFCDHAMLKNDNPVTNPFSNINANESGGLFSFLILLIHILCAISIVATFAFVMVRQMNFPEKSIEIPGVILIGSVMASICAYIGIYLLSKQKKSSKKKRAQEKITKCKKKLLDDQGLSDYLKDSGSE